jgi:hypothetical protein
MPESRFIFLISPDVGVKTTLIPITGTTAASGIHLFLSWRDDNVSRPRWGQKYIEPGPNAPRIRPRPIEAENAVFRPEVGRFPKYREQDHRGESTGQGDLLVPALFLPL